MVGTDLHPDSQRLFKERSFPVDILSVRKPPIEDELTN